MDLVSGSDLSSEIVPFIPMVQLTVLVVGEWPEAHSGSRSNQQAKCNFMISKRVFVVGFVFFFLQATLNQA